MAKKIYLSGKISGHPNFKEKFAQKAKELTDQGHLVFNPALHPDMFTWEQFMELDLKALANCDSIYLLDDWKDSRGAKIEYDEASKHALAIQVDVTGAIGIINNEFSKQGVKSSATLVKAIKEAAYPEFSKKQENKKIKR